MFHKQLAHFSAMLYAICMIAKSRAGGYTYNSNYVI
nr:MAG TPA: hypothetical protein [Caudoviricetes sp.]